MATTKASGMVGGRRSLHEEEHRPHSNPTELHHQQSREIAAHQQKSSASNLVQQTWRDLKRAAHQVYYETRETTLQHPSYLDDFGIPPEEPLLPPTEATGDYLLLPHFTRHHHASVDNLDVFFHSLYQYYYHRGLVPWLGQGVVELITLFFTLWLSVWLCGVDWMALATCHDEATCRGNLTEYWAWRWSWGLTIYGAVFLVYGLWATWSFGQTIQHAYRAKFVFEDRLGISQRKLEGGAVDWDRDVVAKLVELHESGEYRVAVQGGMDALLIAQRIMRKENFMVALWNMDILDWTVPGLKERRFFCKSLEWSLYFCVLSFMFNHRYQIRPAFYLDPQALKRRFTMCGVIHLLFMPFLLFFMTLHFGFQNAYDWKASKQYLGPREWTLEARWRFREFNELPHAFERRMTPSYQAAEDYLKLFGQNEYVVALGRILTFVGGSLGAVLVAFAAVNDAILLHVKIADWNLLWYAGMVGVVYSVGKSMLPTAAARPSSSRNLFAETEAALQKVGTYTHYYPEIWKGRGWDPSTLKSFSSMYKYKAQVFATEIASVILAPYILIVSLANCAEHICEFVLTTRIEVGGVGDVCGFSTFDFEAFHDDAWEGKTTTKDPPLSETLSQSIMRAGSVVDAVKGRPTPRARHGKMEKSFFGFKVGI